MLTDVTDGKVVKENKLFSKSLHNIKVLLYQDEFEVVNPLGSAIKKHKILGVYFTLANILPFNRSTIDHMQLVILCRNKDFKEFGQRKVFVKFCDQ